MLMKVTQPDGKPFPQTQKPPPFFRQQQLPSDHTRASWTQIRADQRNRLRWFSEAALPQSGAKDYPVGSVRDDRERSRLR